LIVLSNAGPLIALGKLNRLTLLTDLYGTVHVPRTVYGEVITAGIAQGRPDAFSVRLFLERYQCPVMEASQEVLRAYQPPVVLDAGEQELLALSHDLQDPLVLLDDEVARSEARRLGLRLKGTLGVLVQAHRQGLLPFREAELLILEIATRPDIWISEKLCQAVLDDLRPRA
jgi:predicted nucleic acid-binding protein